MCVRPYPSNPLSLSLRCILLNNAIHTHNIQIGASEPSFNNCETWEQLRKRVRQFIIEVQKRHQGERVLIVTHGAVVSAFIDELVPSIEGQKHSVRYASLSVFSPADEQQQSSDENGDDDVVKVYKADILCEHSHTDGVE